MIISHKRHSVPRAPRATDSSGALASRHLPRFIHAPLSQIKSRDRFPRNHARIITTAKCRGSSPISSRLEREKNVCLRVAAGIAPGRRGAEYIKSRVSSVRVDRYASKQPVNSIPYVFIRGPSANGVCCTRHVLVIILLAEESPWLHPGRAEKKASSTFFNIQHKIFSNSV